MLWGHLFIFPTDVTVFVRMDDIMNIAKKIAINFDPKLSDLC